MTGLLRLMEIVIIITITVLPTGQSISNIYLDQFPLSTASQEICPRAST